MEVLGLIDLPFWLICAVSIVTVLYLYTSYKQSYFKRLGIPSKPTYPLVGDLPALFKRGLHYVDAELVRKHGKVFGTFVGNVPTLFIAEPEMIKEITIKQFSKFTDRVVSVPVEEKWRTALTIVKGEHWKYLRSTLSPSFTSGKMRNMNALIHRAIETLLDNFDAKPDGESFDIIPCFRGFTMDVICGTGFGLDIDSQKDPNDPFLKYAKEFIEFNPGRNLSFMLFFFFPDLKELLPDARLGSNEAFEFLKNATEAALEERRKNGSKYNDLLNLMVTAESHSDDHDHGSPENMTYEDYKKRGLTDQEIISNSLIFMVAGFDTTANTLIWMSYCLAANPDVQEKLYQEIEQHIGKEKPTYDNLAKMKFLDMVLNETLRLYPATPRVNREASEDVVVCGQRIPKGMDCSIPISAIHMLPEYWPDPTRFDPERFSPENEGNIVPYTHLPFGSGPRNCIGMRLAQLETKMAIVSVLQRYRLSPDPGLKMPPEINPAGLTSPKDPMLLRVHKRDK